MTIKEGSNLFNSIDDEIRRTEEDSGEKELSNHYLEISNWFILSLSVYKFGG